jgi:hypothetical protein
VIAPDNKDWTWVLQQPCAECGFDASTCDAATVPELIRRNAITWRGLVADGTIRPGRPNDHTWSTLEYLCHVRDVYRRFDGRVALMLSEDDPLFPNWDQDASAVDDAYETQAAAKVIDDLTAAAEWFATRLEGLTAGDWDCPGRRSDGANFTVASIARYMMHDPIHHIWDVTGQRL